MINFSSVRPWWLRLAFLLVLGSPLVTGGALHSALHADHFFRDLLWWASYALFLWIFIGLCVGLERLLVWLAWSFVLALSLLVSGALFSKAALWHMVSSLLTAIGIESTIAGTPDAQLIYRLVVIISSTPLAIFALNSFTATDILRWASRRAAAGQNDRRAFLAICLAICFRVFQHVAEVATKALTAWKEENPNLLVPRFRDDWRGSFASRLSFFRWIKDSAWVWCVSLLIQAIVVVPRVVRDFCLLLEDEVST